MIYIPPNFGQFLLPTTPPSMVLHRKNLSFLLLLWEVCLLRSRRSAQKLSLRDLCSQASCWDVLAKCPGGEGVVLVPGPHNQFGAWTPQSVWGEILREVKMALPCRSPFFCYGHLPSLLFSFHLHSQHPSCRGAERRGSVVGCYSIYDFEGVEQPGSIG